MFLLCKHAIYTYKGSNKYDTLAITKSINIGTGMGIFYFKKNAPPLKTTYNIKSYNCMQVCYK
jgi:hypothetical protein